MTTTLNDEIADLRRANAELQTRLDERTAERDEAEAQKGALAEVLEGINSSSGDLAPVFDAMLEKALRLCKADIGVLWTFDGELMHPTAIRSPSSEYADFLREGGPRRPAGPQQPLLQGEPFVQIADLSATEGYRRGDPIPRAVVDLGGVRSLLNVALRKGDKVLGLFAVYRREVRPFSDKQIALLENFAAQAVIAMENARLITETREALDQQIATAEVLGVINSSPGDLAPVFEAILDKAHSLCGAELGVLLTYDGDRFWPMAAHGASARFMDATRQGFRPGRDNPFARVVRGEEVVQIADVSEVAAQGIVDPELRIAVEIGIRTFLIVPLRKDGSLVGAITANRRDVRPFTDKQIALLQNFAAQAVIAIENVHLITETREALEQQTATAEVLGIISSSPGELKPVFEALLGNAVRICDGIFGMLALYEDGGFRGVAAHGVGQEFTATLSRLGQPPPGTGLQLLQTSLQTVQVKDAATDPAYGAVRSLNPQFAKVRTALHVPLLRDETLIGAILIYRDHIQPFEPKQVELVQSFAKQAVIAIENTRLITETREALEQQTATAEVLGVINSSLGDLVPVFEAILGKANYLCETAFGVLWTFDGTHYFPAATHGPQAFIDAIKDRPRPPANGGTLYRHAAGEQVVHIEDMAAETEVYDINSTRRVFVDLGGGHSALSVALHKDGALFGALQVYRQEVRPFTGKQIALLQNFAAQAVIAMENARLLTETREALDQQTATAEVLQVINSSPGDLVPVFDIILEKAHSLCGIAFGSLQLYDGGKFRAVAVRGAADSLADLLRKPIDPVPGGLPTRLLGGELFVQVADLAAFAEQQPDNPRARACAEHGLRTALYVPLRRDADFLGYITAFRQEVRPFTDKQIALLQNFAAQAVIAMENARLITETREALEQQTATAEVLGVINSSPGHLAPVFDAILEKAHLLCGAAHGHLTIYEGEQFRAVATHGVPEEFAALLRQPFRPGLDVAERLRAGANLIHIPDMAALSFAANDRVGRAAVEIAGVRTLLILALRKDEVLLGYLTAHREEVRPFSEKQIALLQNFAAQAVIAMENARLITETREALEQQTATAEVLGVINSSPGDLAPVFDAILEKGMNLCQAAFGILLTYDGERFRHAALHSIPVIYAEFMREHPPIYGPETVPGQFAAGAPLVHIVDMRATDSYRSGDPNRRAIADLAGARTLVAVPLRNESGLLGAVVVFRQQVRPFSDKQITLLQNFAAQAVIAIENARLLDEIRQRQAELRVTFDNMADGVAMFDKELRLAAWNRNFQQMVDLPDALLAERPIYIDYLRILAERGEFGEEDIEAELNRRLEHIDQELRVERTRPNGQVIEVRRSSVPDGGFVLIYSDITERKRSEVEIRTARDAAEATLRDLRAAQANLIQAEKMASLGQLTAGIAHEIKNPLNFVNNFAGLSIELLDELKETTAPAVATLDEDKRTEIDETIEMLTGNLEKIAEHGHRADNIVKSMLEHSRGVSGERREVDLNGLVDEALNLAYHGARAQDQTFNITMERDFDRALRPIEVAPQEMTRVFLNLFGNGFYAANKRAHSVGDASFRPALTVSTRDLVEEVEIKVRDNGTGIPIEIIDKLFQPFFTTKPTGEGTGLGLSISYDIVTQQHGGSITVNSEPGAFTEFTVRLPRQ